MSERAGVTRLGVENALGVIRKTGTELLAKPVAIGQENNVFKLNKGRFTLEIIYKEGDEILDSLPREVVDASSLETFKIRLDRVLSNLV